MNDDLLTQIQNLPPELKEALKHPIIISSISDKLSGSSRDLENLILICKNPEQFLKLINPQFNTKLPKILIESKEPYIVNIKNDLNNYRITYEKVVNDINIIIENTRKTIGEIYPLSKKLQGNIKNYIENYCISIVNLQVPLINKKSGLSQIDPEKYSPKDKKNFINERANVYKKVDDFLTETNQFFDCFSKLTSKNCSKLDMIIEEFLKLPKSVKRLADLMVSSKIKFEKIYKVFNDFSDKNKIDKAFEDIKKPLNEINEMEQNIQKIQVQTMKEAMKNQDKQINQIKSDFDEIETKLKSKSDEISLEIESIREKYKEEKKELNNFEPAGIVEIKTEELVVNILEKTKKINEDIKKFNESLNNSIEMIKKQLRLDLLFIMDITNSMDAYLKEVKQKFLNIINEIRRECGGIEIYLGFIGYRDFNDLDFGEYYINLELSQNYDSILKNINYLDAHGGGDAPEDLCGALEMAKNKKWEGRSRFAILVTDSPCHGNKYYEETEETKENYDNYPDGDREGRNIEEYIEYFAKNDISIFCLKINNSTDKMFNIFTDVYNKNKKKDSTNQFKVDSDNNIFKIITSNAINMFQNRKPIEIE